MPAAKVLPQALIASPERRQEADADREIVLRVQAGEVAAFDALVLRYRERVYGVIYNLIGNREDAADLTQDCFIKAFRSIHRFHAQAAFFTWLYRIAVNSTLSQLRRQRLRSFLSLDQLDTEAPVAKEVIDALTDKSGSDRATFAQELQEKLNDALQRLSIKHRTVVTLFEIDGLNHQEIAEVMGCSEGTVRSRLHYAKQQLQSELAPYLRR
ncbi:MAG: sigma-70 family RNA polymerase sigma factor [Verrucomicrobia bacterium]|nr:sigma-70 family RNA polymerase sigma factor [Verrucomicrobiota bacterium]